MAARKKEPSFARQFHTKLRNIQSKHPIVQVVNCKTSYRYCRQGMHQQLASRRVSKNAGFARPLCFYIWSCIGDGITKVGPHLISEHSLDVNRTRQYPEQAVQIHLDDCLPS